MRQFHDKQQPSWSDDLFYHTSQKQPTEQWRDEVQRHEMNQPEDYFPGWLGLIGAGGALFLKKLAEHRINIILIANMLHRKIIKGGLQMLIFAP